MNNFVTRFRIPLGCKEESTKAPQVCLLHIEDGFADTNAAGRDGGEIAVEGYSRIASFSQAPRRPHIRERIDVREYLVVDIISGFPYLI